MPPKSEAKVTCTCGCKAKVSPRTERRHLAGQATLRAQAAAIAQNPNLPNNSNIFNPAALPTTRQPVANLHPVAAPSTIVDNVVTDEAAPVTTSDVDMDLPAPDHSDNMDLDIEEDVDDPDAVTTAIRNLRSLGTRLAGATLEEYESDEENSDEDGNGLGQEAEDDGIDWFGDCDSEDDDNIDDGEINEDFERELAEFGELNPCRQISVC